MTAGKANLTSFDALGVPKPTPERPPAALDGPGATSALASRGDEKEHAAMPLEGIRRNGGSFDEELREDRFADTPLTRD